MKNDVGERTMGKIVEDTPHFIRVTLDTEFPSRLAKGQDRSGIRLMQPRHFVGKMANADVENPGAQDEDPSGGRRRRSSSKRVRKVTRRHRHRKGSRKLRSKLL